MMLKEGVIEPCVSEWASPIVIIKKKDDTIRLCVGYRRFNAETEMDEYPMPKVDVILDQVGQVPLWTLLKDTGKFLLQRRTGTRQHSLPPKGFTSLRSCHLGSVECPQLSRE